jgi:2-C-methyl-D-erythritol 4-phosphate cytidylyltransferase
VYAMDHYGYDHSENNGLVINRINLFLAQMKKIVVIVAGGNGSRMNTGTPKQFLLLNGKPVLYYTIHTFIKAYAGIEIVLVLPKTHLAEGEQLINSFFKVNTIQIVEGGETRFNSVQNGLKNIKDECVVFVHDGVRCLLTVDLIHRCYETALEYGSAIPVIDSKDSVRILKEDSNEALDRTMIKLVQTPQTFKSSFLLPAFKVAYDSSFTDEASVVEAAGRSIHLVKGEENNIKITQPIDLVIAAEILAASGF